MNSKKSRACTITAHLPMLRIEPERISFHDFDLWRMPFEVYNDLTGGNLDSLKTDYEAVAPVFLQFSSDAQVPDEAEVAEEQNGESEGARVIELRSQESAYQSLGLLGLGSAAAQIRGIWSLISLAFPFLLLPEPGLSQIFVHADDGEIGLSNVRGSRACVQGPADYEYFFLDIPHQRTLKAEDFPRLRDTFKLVGALYDDSSLRFALESFLESLSPVFGWAERTTLCVIALESLLMPEITENLTETFARRLPHLLLGEESGVSVDESLARRLYAARSDEMHGSRSECLRIADRPSRWQPHALSAELFARQQSWCKRDRQSTRFVWTLDAAPDQLMVRGHNNRLRAALKKRVRIASLCDNVLLRS